ncbi:unnamed protein product [Ranitomeya imitator]|uniref:C-type lectin domain-containing protein n=1 Tax=Ranitomeya imitator TaxID=111125 RepID=A0ABN9LPW2_9NEOB|nr:unnamed protein product [Ranitomeya imitator]
MKITVPGLEREDFASSYRQQGPRPQQSTTFSRRAIDNYFAFPMTHNPENVHYIVKITWRYDFLGDYEQENDQLIKVATNEDNIHELLDEDNDEDELDEEDLSLSQEIDQIELDFTEKAENEACPHNGTCHYRVFTKPHCFNKAKKICRSHRGNLSSVHSCTANRDLQWYIKLKASNVRYAWIGVWKSKLLASGTPSAATNAFHLSALTENRPSSSALMHQL